MRPEHWRFTIPLRLRSLFRRTQAEQELDDELRDHIEQKTEAYVAGGLARHEAHRRARLDLDGIEQTKERCRDTRGVNWIQDFVQDLHVGLRMLRKSPGFTVVAVLTLALGIGANTAIFTIVDAVLLRPLPFKDPSRLVMLTESFKSLGFPEVPGSPPDIAVIERTQNCFTSLGAFRNKDFNLSGGGEPEHIIAARVSASIFPMLGIQPLLGRTYSEQEDKSGTHVAVLGYRSVAGSLRRSPKHCRPNHRTGPHSVHRHWCYAEKVSIPTALAKIQ